MFRHCLLNLQNLFGDLTSRAAVILIIDFGTEKVCI